MAAATRSVADRGDPATGVAVIPVPRREVTFRKAVARIIIGVGGSADAPYSRLPGSRQR